MCSVYALRAVPPQAALERERLAAHARAPRARACVARERVRSTRVSKTRVLLRADQGSRTSPYAGPGSCQDQLLAGERSRTKCARAARALRAGAFAPAQVARATRAQLVLLLFGALRPASGGSSTGTSNEWTDGSARVRAQIPAAPQCRANTRASARVFVRPRSHEHRPRLLQSLGRVRRYAGMHAQMRVHALLTSRAVTRVRASRSRYVTVSARPRANGSSALSR